MARQNIFLIEILKHRKCENVKQFSVPKPVFDLIGHWNTCWNCDISNNFTFQMHLSYRRITARHNSTSMLFPLHPSTIFREDILCAYSASEESPSLSAKPTHEYLIWVYKQYGPFYSYNWKKKILYFFYFHLYTIFL